MSDLRRSLRLQQNGYYGPDGTPVISYKETLYKVFKSRKIRHWLPPQSSVGVQEEVRSQIYRPRPPEPRRSPCGSVFDSFLKDCYKFLFFVFMIFGTCYMWKPQSQTDDGRILYDTLLSQGLSDTWRMQGDDWTWRIVSTQRDKLLNFALLSRDATMLKEYSSDTYWPSGLYNAISAWYTTKQHLVLQDRPCLKPHNCWPFVGDKGHVHIELKKPVHIHYITLGHINKKDSPNGQTTSAPQKFSVYGMKTPGGEETLLGRFIYDAENGPRFQTFAIRSSTSESFQHVRVQVESNWGNPDYTCLYNMRVHGTLAHPGETKSIKT